MSNYAVRMARLRENRRTEQKNQEPDDSCGEEQNGCVYCFCHPRPRPRGSYYAHAH